MSYSPEERTKLQVYWVGCGQVTDVEVYWKHENVKLGDPEWQFSDGPVGNRSISYDFLSLEEGLRILSPCIIIMEKS